VSLALKSLRRMVVQPQGLAASDWEDLGEVAREEVLGFQVRFFEGLPLATALVVRKDGRSSHWYSLPERGPEGELVQRAKAEHWTFAQLFEAPGTELTLVKARKIDSANSTSDIHGITHKRGSVEALYTVNTSNDINVSNTGNTSNAINTSNTANANVSNDNEEKL
jgi:hypothetical protein